jgi:hypothetical protein
VPKRSTPRQRIIASIRKQLAKDALDVQESRELFDNYLGRPREVDVVIEGEVAGERVLIGVEVVDHARKAGTPWVEQMIKKHERLPTTKLVLVSWSGFTKPALEVVHLHRGKVRACTPIPVEGDDGALTEDMWVDEIKMWPKRCYVAGELDDGTEVGALAPADIELLDPQGERVGTLLEFLTDVMQRPNFRERVSHEAHSHPQREAATHLTARLPMSPEYPTYTSAAEGLVRIAWLDLTAGFEFAQSKMTLDHVLIDEVQFAVGYGQLPSGHEITFARRVLTDK